MEQLTSGDFWIAAIAAILLNWALEPLRQPLFRTARVVIGLNAAILVFLVLNGTTPLTGNFIIDTMQAFGLACSYCCMASLLSGKGRAIQAYLPWAVVFLSYCVAIRSNFPFPLQGAFGMFPLIICATTFSAILLALLSPLLNSSSSNA